MTYRQAILIAAGGSAALLLGAWGFQYLGGLAPCKMCIWQRWPHGAAALIGLIALAFPHRILALAGMLAALTTSGIGMFHAGVERGWWEGPSSCTGSGSGLTGLSGTDLLSLDAVPALVMCDQVSWQLLGLSMAGWNALIAFALAGFWALAAAKAGRQT